MKWILFFVCLSLPILSKAQPAITSTDMPAPGFSFFYKHAAGFGMIDTTLQGANQIWDFSTLTSSSAADFTISVFDPGQTPYATNFPTANFGYLEGPVPYYNYFNVSVLQMERCGWYNSSEGYTTFSNTQVEFVFPMQLGVSNTDLSLNSGITIPDTLSVNCIGYGSLILPGHTYLNVLMVHTLLRSDILIESYYWYDADNGMPLIDYLPGNGFSIPQAAIYLYNVSNKITEETFFDDIHFNNPVSSGFSLTMYHAKPFSFSYDLINSIGEIVLNGSTENKCFQQVNIEMDNFPSGIYFLSLTDLCIPKTRRSIKLIKL